MSGEHRRSEFVGDRVKERPVSFGQLVAAGFVELHRGAASCGICLPNKIAVRARLNAARAGFSGRYDRYGRSNSHAVRAVR